MATTIAAIKSHMVPPRESEAAAITTSAAKATKSIAFM